MCVMCFRAARYDFSTLCISGFRTLCGSSIVQKMLLCGAAEAGTGLAMSSEGEGLMDKTGRKVEEVRRQAAGVTYPLYSFITD